jgi:hypothetical protein
MRGFETMTTSLSLPKASSRAFGSVQEALPYVNTLSMTGIRPVTFAESVRAARKVLETDHAKKTVKTVCLRADGELWMIEVTRKTWRKIWNFGQF